MTDNNKRTFESGSNGNLNDENILSENLTNESLGTNPLTEDIAEPSLENDPVVNEELNTISEEATLADTAESTFHTNAHTHAADTDLDEGAETHEVRRDREERERAAEEVNRNTTTHTDHHRTPNTTDRDVAENKPFYTTWWFWLIVIAIIIAIWYFNFRTPTI